MPGAPSTKRRGRRSTSGAVAFKIFKKHRHIAGENSSSVVASRAPLERYVRSLFHRCRPELKSRIAQAQLLIRGMGKEQIRSNPAAAPASYGAPLLAELIEIQNGEAFCWVEISDRFRVRATLPLAKIPPGLAPGDEFLWHADEGRGELLPETPQDHEAHGALVRELEQMNSRYYNELRDFDLGLGDE